MTYDEIKQCYSINDVVCSLKDGKNYKYSGLLTLVGLGADAIGYDSVNENCVLFNGCNLAVIIEKGIDEEAEHLKHVLSTCKKLGCTVDELLHMDYLKKLGY